MQYTDDSAGLDHRSGWRAYSVKEDGGEHTTELALIRGGDYVDNVAVNSPTDSDQQRDSLLIGAIAAFLNAGGDHDHMSNIFDMALYISARYDFCLDHHYSLLDIRGYDIEYEFVYVDVVGGKVLCFSPDAYVEGTTLDAYLQEVDSSQPSIEENLVSISTT